MEPGNRHPATAPGTLYRVARLPRGRKSQNPGSLSSKWSATRKSGPRSGTWGSGITWVRLCPVIESKGWTTRPSPVKQDYRDVGTDENPDDDKKTYQALFGKSDVCDADRIHIFLLLHYVYRGYSTARTRYS